MNREGVPIVSENIVWRRTDDGAILISPESGDIRVLNDVGTAIWQLIDGKRSVAQIEKKLQAKYNVAAAKLQADLHAFLEELNERRLLHWKGAESSVSG